MKYDSAQIQDFIDNYSKVGVEAENVKEKTKEINDEIKNTSSATNKITDAMKNTGKNIENNIKKVGKLALAVFGVRSAYLAVRKASSDLATYDTQYATNLEYIRYVLTQAIAPVLKYLVNLAGTLLSYINYISNAWFGISIFGNASAKAFENMKKSASGTAKSAKEIKNTLAGFDEMNVLSDTSSTSGATGGTGGAVPDFDVSSLQGEVPEWLKWIAENKEIVIAGLIGITAGLLALKYGAMGIMGLGIGIALVGIIKLIKDIVDFIKNPSWDKFGDILADLSLALAGVALAMIAFNATNPVGWIILAISAVAMLASFVIKNWDEIKEVLGKIGDWIKEHIITPVANFFKGLWEGIINGVKTAINTIKSVFNSVIDFFKNLISKIVGLFKTIGTTVGNVVSSAFKAVINAVLRTIENVLNAPIKAINGLINVINAIPGINLGKLSTFNLPRLATGAIINRPGMGVNIGGAIAGEAGREGILPLTDSQAMQELGEAIGRYITINANITNTMNGRVISRQLQQINQERNFAYNA